MFLRICAVCILLFGGCGACAAADTVVLKNGQTIHGTIVDSNADVVKIDFNGVTLTYYKDEIASFSQTKQEESSAATDASVATTADIPDEMVRQILEISGFKAQLEDALMSISMPPDTAEKVKSRPDLLPKINELMASLKQTDRAYNRVEQVFRDHFDQGNAETCLRWFASELGKKITGLEFKAQLDKKAGAIAAYAQELRSNPLPPPRITLVLRFNIAVDSVNTVLDVMIDTMQEFAEALNVVAPDDRKVGPEKLAQLGEQTKQQLRSKFESAFFIMGAYTYRDLSDEELTRYLEFLESPAGKWVYATGNKAIISAMREAAAEVAKKLADLYKAAIITAPEQKT